MSFVRRGGYRIPSNAPSIAARSPPWIPRSSSRPFLDPPYFHLLITGQPVTDDFLVRTVDLVVNGLT
jgi:hypothetical protein